MSKRHVRIAPRRLKIKRHLTDDGKILLKSLEENKKEGEEGIFICLRELKFDFDMCANI